MKVAITADLHLAPKEDSPKRWSTFRNILEDISEREINTIIIAGDLFYKDYRNYSEFDGLAHQYRNIYFHIIPGNHDPIINQRAFISANIIVYNETQIVNFDNSSTSFLFVPYTPEVSMGEEIASHRNMLSPGKWILVSHGDWADSIRAPNPAEPGIYMPLSKKDLKDYKPALTLLGHIHKPMDDLDYSVYYTGSPCGLDINEVGRRRYLILDTETFELESIKVDSEVIYFNETIVVYPLEDEEQYLRNEIKGIKEKWSLTLEEKSKTQIRIKVTGSSSNKRRLKEIFDEEFEDYSFWKNEEVDVLDVSDSENYELSRISEGVFEKINEKYGEEKEGEPTKQEILSKAIQKIYSVG